MDIQKASNLERYLYYLFNEDSDQLNQAMEQFNRTGVLSFDDQQVAEMRLVFDAASVDNDQTLEMIRNFHSKTGYLLDPHTATGVKAGKDLCLGQYPLVCLATAHPAKFPQAVKKAIGKEPLKPKSLEGLDTRNRKCEILNADVNEVRSFLSQNALL